MSLCSGFRKGWNAASKGSWFQAFGGEYPNDPNSNLRISEFRGRESDDPSVVLAFLTYDWLHHMYLRPNIESTVNMLSANLWSGNNAISMYSELIPSAMAAEDEHLPVTFGVFNLNTSGENDPRDLRKYNEDPDSYKRQFANVFGYVPADMTLPSTSLVVSMDENSRVVTTNGQPASSLYALWHAMVAMNDHGSKTFAIAHEILDQKVTEIVKLEQQIKINPSPELVGARDRSLQQARRAMNAVENASYAINLSLGLLNDRKTITALGVTKNGEDHFQIVQGNFYPAMRSATAGEILAGGIVSTGQNAQAGNSDWCLPLDQNGHSKLNFFVKGGKFVSMRKDISGGLLQPALAASAIPQSNKNIFVFSVSGDVSKSANDGKINLTKPNINLTEISLKPEQLMYQNTASLITDSGNAGMKESWNCIARDNGANYSGKGYFSSQKSSQASSSEQNYPSIVAEWSLRCPAPITGNCQKKPIIALHSKSDFDDKKRANYDIDDVVPVTDAAGNISYTFKGQPMHFLSGDEWLAAVKESSDANNKDVVGNVGPLILRRDARVNSTINAFRMSDSEWQQWANDHQLLTNTSQFGSYQYKGATIEGDLKYSIYSQIVFELLDADMCPQLYRWSS